VEKIVLIISTLDTKGTETLYLKERIKSLGLRPLLMDLSMRGKEPSPAEITPAEIAEAGGSSIQEIHSSRDRAQITNVTIKGAKAVALKLYQEGKIDAIVGLGGSTGSLMATEVMRSLPFGLPKLMISSTAALPGLSTRYIGTGDIALLHSVIEISGLSNLLKNVLERAAGAVYGMITDHITEPAGSGEKAIALTMLGPCEQCASAVRRALEQKGYQVIGFSAAGIGDRAMEEMISQGFFQGVIDLAPGGVGEHLFGFMRDAGPRRLESAGEMGIPQVISTCSVNHMTPAKSKYKPEYHQRPKYDLDKYRTWIRLNEEELRLVAHTFAEKLNRAKGPVRIVIPLRGWSSVDIPGNPTYNPEQDQIFVDELRKNLNQQIQIVEVDANMEDPAFADRVVQVALEVL